MNRVLYFKSYAPDVKRIVESIIDDYPFIEMGEINSCPAYHIGDGKFFLILSADSIAIKVPGPMANMLTEIFNFPRLLPCKELIGSHWVLITRKNPKEYIADKAVINEAILYALGLVY